MKAATKKLLVDLATEHNVKVSDEYMTRLENFDGIVRGVVKAQRTVDEKRSNFSAAILDLVREAPSPEYLLGALDTMRADYKRGGKDEAPDAEYTQYSTAMSRCRTAFQRITGSKDTDKWDAGWDKVQQEAKSAKNLTHFVTGEEKERGRGGASKRAQRADKGATKVAVTLPDAPDIDIPDVEQSEWPEEPRKAYATLAAWAEAVNKADILSAQYTDPILKLARDGMLYRIELARQSEKEAEIKASKKSKKSA